MTPVVELVPALRACGGRQARRLAVRVFVAFAVCSAVGLTVVHCWLVKGRGAAHAHPLGAPLAGAVAGVLVVALLALAGRSAGVAAARRGERLDALRLLGATPGEVRTLAVLGPTVLAVLGAVSGTGVYAATAQARRLAGHLMGEPWPGWWVLVAPVVAGSVGAGSALWSAARVRRRAVPHRTPPVSSSSPVRVAGL